MVWFMAGPGGMQSAKRLWRAQSLETAPARRQTGNALHRMATPVLLLSSVCACAGAGAGGRLRGPIIGAMKLHQMRYIAAVAAHGSIRAAARALGVTQAAVTQGMRELEADCQLALFTRHSAGIGLTPAVARRSACR